MTSNGYTLDMLRKCLHYSDCSYETMDLLKSKLPKILITGSYDKYSDPEAKPLSFVEQIKRNVKQFFNLKSERVHEPEVHELTLKSYISSTRLKQDTYYDWPGVLDHVKGEHRISMHTLKWFFARGERLDEEDLYKILSTNTFNEYSKDINDLETVLQNTSGTVRSKSSLILGAVCTSSASHKHTVQLLTKYINSGIVPIEDTWNKCVSDTYVMLGHSYRNYQRTVDEKTEIIAVLNSSK